MKTTGPGRRWLPGAAGQTATRGDGGLGGTASPRIHGPTASTGLQQLLLLFHLQKTAQQAWQQESNDLKNIFFKQIQTPSRHSTVNASTRHRPRIE